MRKLSFVLTILGISILLVMLNFSGKKVESLEGLELNEKVIVSGEILKERDFGDFKIFNMGEIEVYCNCKESYLGKEVLIEGLVAEFDGEKQVKVLKIKILHN